VLYFLHPDHLGSTSLTTDASSNAVARQLYDAWGNIRLRGDLKTDIGYTSQREDLSTNLMFYRARYFSPALGRFLSADTMVPDEKNPQNLNRFAYTLNNPLRFTDPSGHFCLGGKTGDEPTPCADPKPQTPDILQELTAENTTLAEFPVGSDEVGGFSYGEPRDDGTVHPGTDVAGGRLWDPIRAVAKGRVFMIRQDVDANGNLVDFGNWIVIRHRVDEETYYSLYAHMIGDNEFNLEVGQIIERGTQIGSVGSTGRSTGPHLHFEGRTESGISFDNQGVPFIAVYYPTPAQLNKYFMDPHEFVAWLNAIGRPSRYEQE
jgi:RHS repeat-associated protein